MIVYVSVYLLFCAVIPTPINVTREATNTTVKLWWELPDSKLLGDSDYYNV